MTSDDVWWHSQWGERAATAEWKVMATDDVK